MKQPDVMRLPWRIEDEPYAGYNEYEGFGVVCHYRDEEGELQEQEVARGIPRREWAEQIVRDHNAAPGLVNLAKTLRVVVSDGKHPGMVKLIDLFLAQAEGRE